MEKKQTYRLRTIRLKEGMTQVELAQLVGIKTDTLSKLERDEQTEWPRKPIRLLIDMAKVLNVNPMELYNELVWQEETREQTST